jgi:cytochrome c oxidase cbb3-type subunit 4
MKFINYLQSIEGVSFYPMVSLVLFTSFFTVAAILALKAEKGSMMRKSRIPLDNDEK